MHQIILNDNSTSNSESISSLNENTDKSVQELIDFVENEFINKEYNLSTNTSSTNYDNNEYNNLQQFNDNLFKRELNTDHHFYAQDINLLKKETNEHCEEETNLNRKEFNKNQSFFNQVDNLLMKESNQDHSYGNEINVDHSNRKELNDYNLCKQKIDNHLNEQESKEDHSFRKELNDAINNLSNSSSSIGQQQFSNTFFNDNRSSSPISEKLTPNKKSSIKISLSPSQKRSPIKKKSPTIKRKLSPCIKKASSSNNQEDVHIPRPPNAFMIFGKHNRKLLANQYPQFTNKEISKILGDEWRNLKPDDKEHYHELSNKAHVEHLKKYPGYYYNPLEARKRKADRQNKNVQKTNSKRIYGKQNYLEEKSDLEQLNYDIQSIDSNKLLLTSTPSTITTSSTATNDNCQQTDSTNKILPNFKLKIEKNQLYNNYTNSQSSIQLPQFRQQPKNELNLINKQFDNNTLSNVSKRSNNQFNLNIQLKNQQEELKDCQNLLQPNVLYRSNNENNNVLNYLLKNSNNSSNNINEILNNTEKFINQNSIHHHYQTNCYTTPTIYHITDKDPNLNSTLNDNCFLNNNLNNGIINYNFFNNLNINNQNLATTNSISLQNQNENNSSQINSQFQDHQTTATSPLDSFSLDEFLAEYNRYNSNLQQTSKNQFNKQN